jgi:hypothetical protein
MALTKYENMVQALGPDRSDPALGDCVGSRRSEWRANLGNTNIAHPTMECGAITTVAIMNEKSRWLAIPSTAFDNLLSRPRGGGIRRHVHVENLPAGVIDHEENVQRSERDRSDAEEVARPDLRPVLPQERPPSGGRPATHAKIQKRRSASSRRGRGMRRCRTSSCCRRQRLSAISSAFGRTAAANAHSKQRSIDLSPCC